MLQMSSHKSLFELQSHISMNSEQEKQIVVRFPPSPTGFLHVGSARTALFNYLFAKKMNGKLILRIEDTDTDRSEKHFEENIIEGLNWLGITYDEFYRQSERTEIYTSYLHRLVESGHAYVSNEPAKSGEGTVDVVRFKNPNTCITFTDAVRGEITFDTTDLKDFVIAKSMTEPLYHLAVVVDDFEMGVTHIIRGEDGISNTPRQILIQEALGAPRPVYAHIPLILGPDRSKLSKRHGAEPITSLRDDGYLAESVINHLAFLGWNPGDEREIMRIHELIDSFSLDHIQKGGAIWNQEKLLWYNHEYLKLLSAQDRFDLAKRFIPSDLMNMESYTDEKMKKVLTVLSEREIKKLSDIPHCYTSGMFSYFFEKPTFGRNILCFKEQSADHASHHLSQIEERLQSITESQFSAANIKESLWNYATEHGRGEVLWPFRVALTGREKSPDPFIVAEIVGKKETFSRIINAKKLLSQ